MYHGVGQILKRYWTAYGGWSAFLRSPYLHFSFVLTILTAHFWLTEKWWDQPISVIPNLLGFSLGGLAMFLSFGDEKFRSELMEHKDGEISSYLGLSSTFVHFIILQVLALSLAIVAKGLDFYFYWPTCIRSIIDISTKIFSGFGYLIFLYSVISMVAATLGIFRACSWYQLIQNSNRNSPDKKN
ncbi:hypothetical protein ACO0K2_18060 [Undibacterium sp. MH2W]|uniref:hypothetical protein n=1 Tax=Undibacterium sp. MH2W TaxID=3413044 RepID=UPI003BF1B45B